MLLVRLKIFMRVIPLLFIFIVHAQNVFTQADTLTIDFGIPELERNHNIKSLKYYLEFQSKDKEKFYGIVDSLLHESNIRGSFKRILIDTVFKELVTIPPQLKILVRDSFDYYIAALRPYFDNNAESHFPLLLKLASNNNLKNQIANSVLLSPKLRSCNYFESKEDNRLSQHQIKMALAAMLQDIPERIIYLREIACDECLRKNLNEILDYIKYLPRK